MAQVAKRVSQRRPPRAAFVPATPKSPEEERFVRSFAHALVHATALAASDPETPLPSGSFAEQVRSAWARSRPAHHLRIRDRARARLAAPLEERRRDFGARADWTPETEGALADELRGELKAAVRARLDSNRQAIVERFSAYGIASSLANWSATKTLLEAGYFTGDVVANWKEMTINSPPPTVQFMWSTQEPDAEHGVWQLFRVGPGKTETLLASGEAGDAPGPRVFTLDLSEFLPPTAPSVPALYHVRVSPQTKMTMKPSANQGEVGAKVLGHAVGPASDPVIITYSSISSPAPNWEVWQLYRVMTTGPTKIHMVEDQFGPGAEEFWIAGFVQEFLPKGSSQKGKQQKFGPRYVELDPDGPRWGEIAIPIDFWLSNPDSGDFPRAYAFVVSVLEEDDGGSFNDWHAELADLANQFLVGNVADDVEEYLQQEFQDFVSDNWEQILTQAPAVAEDIVAMVSSSTAGIVGMAIAIAAFVIAAIVSDAGDDFYGVQAYTFPVVTNIRDYVESIPGHQTAEGYTLHEDPFTMLGTPSVLQASSYDGKVEIYMDCHFSQLETY
jgi:hypothetical protein